MRTDSLFQPAVYDSRQGNARCIAPSFPRSGLYLASSAIPHQAFKDGAISVLRLEREQEYGTVKTQFIYAVTAHGMREEIKSPDLSTLRVSGCLTAQILASTELALQPNSPTPTTETLIERRNENENRNMRPAVYATAPRQPSGGPILA
ncbi:hypothetical protein B2J93_8444 [Marssonina coronariae]|uniref:Uncharacterized protein n=1 Tax=Diplocarpon coronariae TaxID=2795749 RepID=A0A218YZK5_9HELO|nr:hypothetical protein B2J93_8444 [Marssonina coronariae]